MRIWKEKKRGDSLRVCRVLAICGACLGGLAANAMVWICSAAEGAFCLANGVMRFDWHGAGTDAEVQRVLIGPMDTEDAQFEV